MAATSQRRSRAPAAKTRATSAATAALLFLLLTIAGGALAAPAPAPAPRPPTRGAAAPARPAAAASSSSLPPGELAPIYGNYCGFQNSSCLDASFRKAPVDALDALCKKHDQCWCRSGPMDCACDKALLEGARQLIRSSSSSSSSSSAARSPLPASTAAMATSVVAYFTIAPCVCRERRFCVPTCGLRAGCSWGGPGCRQAVSPGLGGACALKR